MGLRSWFSWLARGSSVTAGFSGESTPRPIDQLFLEMRGAGSSVSRDEALTVPAMLRARNMVCSIATLPLRQLDLKNNTVRSPLLEQIDPHVANVVTLAQTFEDLVMDAIAWWEITAFGADGFPMAATRRSPNSVSLTPPVSTRTPAPLPSGQDPRGASVWVDGREVPGTSMIRFDSPHPAVLKVAARSIRRALLFEQTAAVYADDPRPMDYFTPADGAEDLDDDEAQDMLDDWKQWRKTRSTGYVPSSVKYNTVDAPTPADLQLAELKREAKLDIANALGVDPEDLGVSTTSRTYANAVDRRRDRVNDVLAPYMSAVTDRLSMGDVTKRGYRVTFDLDDYMKSNPTERWNVYQIAKNMGALTVDEIRAKEQEPPLSTQDTGTVQDGQQQVAAHGNVVTLRLDNAQSLHFADIPVHQFAVDVNARTIEGMAAPYGKVGTKGGVQFRFERGSLQFGDPARVKLLRDHDFTQPLGYAEEIKDTPAGLKVRFKIGRGEEGDRALMMAEDRILDGLSVGVDFDMAADTVPDPRNRGGFLIRRSDLKEVSLTPMPAFDDARVTRVAASYYQGSFPMLCATCQTEHAPNVACSQNQQQNQQQPAAMQFGQQPVQFPNFGQQQQPPQFVQQPPAAGQQQVQMSMDQLGQLLARQGYAAHALSQAGDQHQQPNGQQPAGGQQPAADGRTVVDATRLTASTVVTEKDPYRLDRRGNIRKGTHDFSGDLFAAWGGDSAAHDRAVGWVSKTFDVATGDVNELNPTINRPELYVDQKDFTYPVWDAINKGNLAVITPFTFPKFSSASGLVGAHTEGTEPTSGTLVTTSQTVTPTAVSGKARITRETWDQGGNPQVSNLIWRQMVKGWFEALEAAAIAVLDAATPTGITLTTGGGTDGRTAVAELEAAFTALQYIRGGFRFDTAFAQIDLYKTLSAAKDTTGRPMYPSIGPMNANGQVQARFRALDVNGIPFLPAWALAASGTVAASSYLFDSADVSGWASSPQRLEFQVEVASVSIGIWGYKATAISDITGVREIIYDPA